MAVASPPPTLQHRLEYLAIRSVVGLLGLVSFGAGSQVGAWLGVLGYRLGIRRRVVEAQIAFAFPEFTPDQVRAVAIASYENLGRTSLEAALMERRAPSDLIAEFECVDGWEHLEAAQAQGRGTVLITGHLGNWELGGSYFAARGMPVDAIARHMSNRLFERYLTRVRQRFGIRIVFDDQAVRQTPRSLREFALRMEVPVLFTAVLRQPSGKYRLVVEPIEVVVTGDREADTSALVASYTARLEYWVRQCPGQYFWQHRRWKYQPEGAPPLPEGM